MMAYGLAWPGCELRRDIGFHASGWCNRDIEAQPVPCSARAEVSLLHIDDMTVVSRVASSGTRRR
jgi:hypothetical protein